MSLEKRIEKLERLRVDDPGSNGAGLARQRFDALPDEVIDLACDGDIEQAAQLAEMDPGELWQILEEVTKPFLKGLTDEDLGLLVQNLEVAEQQARMKIGGLDGDDENDRFGGLDG